MVIRLCVHTHNLITIQSVNPTPVFIMKKALKNIAFGVIAILIAVMATATFIEAGEGTQFVTEKIYARMSSK